MLLTFGDINTREKYQGPRATTITAIVSNALSADMPMGIAMVTMRTRFAGLVRPEQAGPRDELTQQVSLPIQRGEPMPKPAGRTPLMSDFVLQS
jgi:hypothetical protein